MKVQGPLPQPEHPHGLSARPPRRADYLGRLSAKFFRCAPQHERAPAEPVSPHGLRAGFVTTAYGNGVPDEEIMGH
jgi:hypothetical protein